jgi:23S rRNA (pseudouridine1915-N3)-methyltransferase
MRFRVCVVETPKLAYAKLAVDEYVKRLRAYGGAEVLSVRSGTAAAEGERLLKASEGCRRVLLDERGEALTTAQWKERFERWEMEGARDVAFLIGGAEGHGAAVREAVNETWSLSPLTLQHELALVVLLEQMYRVQSWRRGEPYHRAGMRE